MTFNSPFLNLKGPISKTFYVIKGLIRSAGWLSIGSGNRRKAGWSVQNISSTTSV